MATGRWTCSAWCTTRTHRSSAPQCTEDFTRRRRRRRPPCRRRRHRRRRRRCRPPTRLTAGAAGGAAAAVAPAALASPAPPPAPRHLAAAAHAVAAAAVKSAAAALAATTVLSARRALWLASGAAAAAVAAAFTAAAQAAAQAATAHAAATHAAATRAAAAHAVAAAAHAVAAAAVAPAAVAAAAAARRRRPRRTCTNSGSCASRAPSPTACSSRGVSCYAADGSALPVRVGSDCPSQYCASNPDDDDGDLEAPPLQRAWAAVDNDDGTKWFDPQMSCVDVAGQCTVSSRLRLELPTAAAVHEYEFRTPIDNMFRDPVRWQFGIVRGGCPGCPFELLSEVDLGDAGGPRASCPTAGMGTRATGGMARTRRRCRRGDRRRRRCRRRRRRRLRRDPLPAGAPRSHRCRRRRARRRRRRWPRRCADFSAVRGPLVPSTPACLQPLKCDCSRRRGAIRLRR